MSDSAPPAPAPDPAPDARAGAPSPPARWAASWIVYDLANTIYSGIVITFFVVPYITKNLGAPVTAFSLANFGSMILGGLLCPILGALADKTGGTRAALRFWTYLCCATCVGMGVFGGQLWMVLALLFISNMAFQVGLIFYNALLPVVAAPKHQGKVSGLGVGIGYLGVLLALAIVMPVIGPIGEWVAGAGASDAEVEALGRRSAFVLAGALFLLFALPCLFLVPERRVANPEQRSWALVKRELGPVLQTFKDLRGDRVLLLFFLGNFACVDTLNTAIAFFATFIENVFHYGPEDKQTFLLLGGLNAFALLGGLIMGWLADRKGGLPMLFLSGAALGVALLVASITTDWWVFSIALLGPGVLGLSGVWTAGRAALLELVPKERVGAYFGIYGMATKLSVLGSLTYGFVADGVSRVPPDATEAMKLTAKETGHRLALGVQLIPLTIGLALIFWCWQLAKRRPRPAPAPLEPTP